MSSKNASQQLTNLLISKNFDPQSLDAQGKPAANPEDAAMFSFDYKGESGKDYGTVVCMIDDNNNMNVYFGDNLGKGMEGDDKKEWFDFLYQIRQFAKRNMMTFSLQNLNKLKYSRQGQAALAEGLFEGWSGTKNTSWNAAPTEARLMIKHKKNLGETDARFRYIESLFIETQDGERFRMPFKSLTAGKAMLEHVRSGGKPYDIRGNHITTIVEELNLLARFRRANQGKIFEGDAEQLVEEATLYYETLKHNLKSLSTRTGYKKYFESWNPAALTDEDVIIEDLRHLFVEQNIDTRVEQALPLLAKLKQEQAMKEINVFESMMNLITEGTWALPDTPEKQQQLIQLLSDELPVGADATNATELLYDLLGDDELFDQLGDLAREDANADARTIIINRLEQMKSNPAVAQVIGKLKVETTPQAQPQGQEPVQEGESCQVCHESTCSGNHEQVEEGFNTYAMDDTPCPVCHEKELTYDQGADFVQCGSCATSFDTDGNVLDDEQNLEIDLDEQLDRIYELSRGTLGSYVKKASSDRVNRNFNQGFDTGKSFDRREPEFDHDNARRDDSRRKGIHQAVNRLTQEASDTVEKDAEGRVKSWKHEGDWEKSKGKDLRGQVTRLSDVARRKTEKPTKVDEDMDNSSPVESAIIRRIMMAHTDLLQKFGPEAIMNAAREQAEWVGDVEEIGSSDVSAWVKRIITDLEGSQLDESGMSEVDLLLQEIARGAVDIYDIYANPKTATEMFVQEQLHEKAEEISRERGIDLDGDIDKILQIIHADLQDDYGIDEGRSDFPDETEHEYNNRQNTSSMSESSGDRTALTGQYGHSGKMSAVEGTDADMMDRIKFLAGLSK